MTHLTLFIYVHIPLYSMPFGPKPRFRSYTCINRGQREDLIFTLPIVFPCTQSPLL